MLELTRLSEREYRLISKLVYEKFGINLGEHKKSLIIGRLQKILKQHKFSSFQQYYDYVTNEPTGEALVTLVDRISTNHTYFYREHDHFEFFSNTVLPEITRTSGARNQHEFRLWCSGCSSGEEPYTLAMLMLEFFGNDISTWKPAILATDISLSALEKAKNGVYPAENVSHLPPKLKNKYFIKAGNDMLKVTDQVKRLITFKRLNLMRTSFPFKRKFHTIFCRNVMIYFDQPTRDALIARYHGNMVNEGYLFIGHSESLRRDNKYFSYVKPSVYKIAS